MMNLHEEFRDKRHFNRTFQHGVESYPFSLQSLLSIIEAVSASASVNVNNETFHTNGAQFWQYLKYITFR